MSTTLDNLVDLVNSELENRKHYGTAETVADGVADEWCIAPLGYMVLDDADFQCLKDGTVETEPTDFTMNFDNGVCTMSSIPAVGTSMKWWFNYASWSDTQVEDAINAGIQALFPFAYYEYVDEITTDGVLDEYDLDSNVEFIKAYDFKSSGATNWTKKRMRDFELFTDDTHKVLSFFSVPDAGTVRAHVISRPFSLSAYDDTLEDDAHVPARFTYPIVSYACYYLMTQKTAPRARGDVAVATQGQGTLSPRQMNDASNAFYMRFQMQLRSIRMNPWSMR